ncbi:MAG: Mu transposase C-terminal domain-containing protein [Peptococcaceae bacterium]|nr:Mu transposase C-terminal domain-containing protein [Peptococcaceae bacterium]MDH7526016.1 Mu transposase C-terminal domain-containing protein [Peptococcaceae bacterium]
MVKKEKINTGCGGGGMAYLIALSSLSTLAQRRWFESQQTQAETNEPDPDEETDFLSENDKITAPRIANLAEIKALVGEERFTQLLQEAEEAARPVIEYLNLSEGAQKTAKAINIAKKYDISINTLYRRVQLYRGGGVAALMRRLPSLGTGTIRRVVPEEVERFTYGEYLQRNKPKAAHVYKKVKKFCELNGFEIPSRATIYRVIKELNETNPALVCLAREGEEEYMKRFAEKATRKEPEFVNQVWEGDHHRCDFFINYRGRAIRPWLTVWLDVASRTIAGWALSVQANGRTIALALRYGILPKKLSEISCTSKAMAVSMAALGWDIETLRQQSGTSLPIMGLPRTLYIDNGEDYKSKVRKGLKCEGFEYSKEVRSSCDILGISAQFCTKYSPWAKGHCERWFGTMTDQFSRYLPGYCGKDNKHRPEGLDEQAMAERDDLLDLEEASLLLEVYINEYHNTVHSTLGMTPLEKYRMTPKVREGIPDERTLDICLMDVERAKIMASGIQRFGTKNKRRWYSHPELEKYVGQNVVIRFDPNRIGELLVFNTKNGCYICTATNKELMDWQASQDDIREFQKRRASRKKQVKEIWRGYQQSTLETVVAERQEAGPAMVTGETASGAKGIKMITGMEQAAKGHNKSAAAKKQKPAVNSRFDEYIIQQAGNQY